MSNNFKAIDLTSEEGEENSSINMMSIGSLEQAAKQTQHSFGQRSDEPEAETSPDWLNSFLGNGNSLSGEGDLSASAQYSSLLANDDVLSLNSDANSRKRNHENLL